MARTYPLDLPSFWDLIAADTSGIGKFTLGESRQINISGGGQLIDASLGARLWTCDVSLVPKAHHAMSAIEAQVEVLLEAGASFLAYDPRKQYPAADRFGTVLASSLVTLTTVNANNRDIRFSGLPAGYVLTPGDMFSFTYLSGPTRYALHRIVVGDTATSAGVAMVEVTPPFRAGFTIGDPMIFGKPRMLAKIVPGSYRPPSGGPGKLSSGLNFTLTQSLRP